MLCANRVEAILQPGSASAKRLVKTAKDNKCYLDMTSGRATKCLLMLDGGKLIGCALTSKTIVSRLNNKDGNDEDHSDLEVVE